MSERFCPRDGSALRSQNKQGDLVGTVIAERYHVMKKLGEGGMGAVYLAEHVKMGRKSAIKVMNPGMHQDADAIARFNREAANASRLNHPNICAIYDFGETSEGLIYLAMEFIEGQSLTSLIEGAGALAPARAASIVHQAADALQVAHDYGIVHRDLKPDNIMITKDRTGADVAKVVDFGIAKASSSDAQKVTKTGLVVGTPEYMSPEQLAGDKLDGRSDIYSLALVAFNCFTGTLPFPSNSAQEAMIMRLTDLPKTLAEMKPDVAWPDQLQAVMDRALARDANERYGSAAEFGRDLSRAVEGMPAGGGNSAEAGTVVMSAPVTTAGSQIPATRVAGRAERTPAASSAPTVAQAAVAAPAPAAPPAAAEPAPKGGGMGLIAAVVGGLVVVGGGVFYAMNNKAPSPQVSTVAPAVGGQATPGGSPAGGSPAGGTPSSGAASPAPGPVTPAGGAPSGGSAPVPAPSGGSKAPAPAPTADLATQLASLRHDAEDTENTANSADVLRRAAALEGKATSEKDKVLIAYSKAMAHLKGQNTDAGCPLLKQVAPKAGLIGAGDQVKAFMPYCQ
jgi:serine/threonine-protein kinase